MFELPVVAVVALSKSHEGHFGLKGRFFQPGPKAWESRHPRIFGLKGRFGHWRIRPANGPCRADDCRRCVPRPSAWADRIGLSGRRQGVVPARIDARICCLTWSVKFSFLACTPQNPAL